MGNLNAAGSTVTQSTPDTNIVNGALAGATWTDLDLSSIVGGAAAGFAILRVQNLTGGAAYAYFRMNGDTSGLNNGGWNGIASIANNAIFMCSVPFPATGIIEYYTTAGNWKIDVIGYIHE